MNARRLVTLVAATAGLSCGGGGAGAVDATTADLPAGCTGSGVTRADATRTTEAGSVTVDAILVNVLAHCAKEKLTFDLVLDTHSVDLLGIDVAGTARVELDGGASIAAGFTWTGRSESSHHREGVLEVAAPPLAGVTSLTLVLADVAGAERVFEWDAGYLVHDLP